MSREKYPVTNSIDRSSATGGAELMSESRPPDDTPRWQPIETAPKERYVLLTEVTEPSASDLHQHPDAQPIARTTVGRLAHWDGEWRWERYGIGNIATRRLTHWMPLPEPPHD